MTNNLDIDRDDDAEDAARLISYGFRPKLHPNRDSEYAALVRRYDEDPAFEQLVKKNASGLGLRIIGITMRAGAVLGAVPGSAFETKLENYARQARQAHQRESERILHGIVHLAIAALCFPRPEDLADDGYVGQATATAVDDLIRHTCMELDKRVVKAEENSDPLAAAPELERVWRVYLRRPEARLNRRWSQAPALYRGHRGQGPPLLTRACSSRAKTTSGLSRSSARPAVTSCR